MSAYETTVFFAVLMIVLLLGLLIAGFIYFMARQGRRYYRLQRQYFSAQASAEEAERQRIADTLHDEHNCRLATIRYGLEDIRPADEQSRQQLETVRTQIDTAAAQVRALAQNLQPLMLEQMGLHRSLQAFLRTLPPDFAARVVLQCRVPTTLKNPGLLSIYRAVQELLNNALKHSRCRRLLLQVKEEDGWLRIHYMDDGVGFDANALPGAGRGLNSLQSRVQLLGGTLKVQSSPGEGTRYFMELPIASLI